MSTPSRSTSPTSPVAIDINEDIISDLDVETKDFTAPPPYIWETWQTEILNNYLPTYKANKSTGPRTAILDKVFRKMKEKKVIPDSDVSELRKAIKRWFGLKARIRQPKQYKIRSVNWNYRTVAAVVKKQAIKEAEIDMAAGRPVKFGSYQVGLNNVLEKMDEEELNALKLTAAQWNAEGPPADEQNRLSVKYGPKYAKAFAEKCFKQLGARVLIYWGSMDTDGSLVSARFDFNNELGGGTAYKDMFNDDSISDRTWGKYLEKVYKPLEGTAAQQLQPRGSPMDLEVTEDGEPLLPEEKDWPSDLTGEGLIKWQKRLLRSFLGHHYALVTQDENHRCPWADIIKEPEAFIDAEYLPDYDSLVKEPSHLAIAKVRKLLRFWLERQSSGQIPFRWKSVLENGERVNATELKVNLRKSKTKSTGEKEPKLKIASRQKRSREPLSTFIDSDDDAPAPAAGRIKVKPRPTKKSKVVAPLNIDEGNSGEEFDFGNIDEMECSDDEPIHKSAKVQPSKKPKLAPQLQIDRGTSGEEFNVDHKALLHDAAKDESAIDADDQARDGTAISPDLRPLWKVFTDKLPLEYKSWSKEQLHTQFEVFRGWAGQTGLLTADGFSAAAVHSHEKATANALLGTADNSNYIGNLAVPFNNVRSGDSSADHLSAAAAHSPDQAAADALLGTADNSNHIRNLDVPFNNVRNSDPLHSANQIISSTLKPDQPPQAAAAAEAESKSLTAELKPATLQMGGMQTRKRKAELDADTVLKKAKQSDSSVVPGKRSTRSTSGKAKQSENVLANPPKRGRGRPRKNATV